MIRVNGVNQEVDQMTLAEYLQTTDYDDKRIAVERNGQIVPRSQYHETVLQSGDQIEIVSFVGGG